MFNDKRYLLIGLAGCLLVVYGLILPSLITNWSGLIIQTIDESILLHESGRLLIAAFTYVAKYLLLFFLIYFGAMMIAHSLSKSVEGVEFSFLFIIIASLSFYSYNQLYQENFSYLSHMITLGILVLHQLYIPKQKHFTVIFSIILFLVIMAVQWLQLIPALSPFGIGTNDIAVSIKLVDNYFTENNLFNTLATIFFFVFLIIAIIFTFLIHLVNKQIHTFNKYQEKEEELKETRVALVESKVYEEIVRLVHDLKTPLVTVEGLLSLIDLKMQPETQSKSAAYFERMDQSLTKMKDMISEILYEQTTHPIVVKELLEYVTSHLSLDEQLITLQIEIDKNVPPIHVNKIRFSRAIANLMENAITSFAGKAGEIDIHVKRVGSAVLIQVRDNGPGIPPDHLECIWIDGFTTRNSSGLGLSFVKKVVESHQGTITLDSIPGSHTKMNILIPIQKEGDKNDEHDHLNR